MTPIFGTKFRKAIEHRAETQHSRVIHALDIADTFRPDVSAPKKQQLISRACKLAQAIAPHVAAIKLNYPLVLSTGLEIAEHLKQAEPNIPLIADFKVADIDSTNAWIASHVFSSGIDAIIIHAFIGTDAIQAVLDEAHNYGDRGVILVVDMSHPGSLQFIHPQAKRFAQLAVDLGVTGVIAPGTRPKHITQIRTWIGPNLLIFAPGVGAQGGKPGSAIAAGADYEIIGRSIYQASKPAEAAKRFGDSTYKAGQSKVIPQSEQILSPIPTSNDAAITKEVALILHDAGAWKFGSFILASGQTSPYYLDLRLIPSHPQAFTKLINLQVSWLAAHLDIKFDRIAGIPTAGLSFGTLLAHQLNKPLLYVRNMAKKHGLGRIVEGELHPGDHVLVVDDLISDGASKLDAVQALRAKGAKVTDVFVIVDREQNGAANLRKAQLHLRSLTTISELVHVLSQCGRLPKRQVQKILDYLAQHRV
ncbi:MAG: orotidine-5'-phosphate decarboxylase [Promethearchaeota archaeon]